jgi:peptidoglycan hydrolase-like protein with peptidoglycan-binding domain
MNSIKKYLENMRLYTFPKTRALEQELDAVRKAYDLVSSDLEKMQETLRHARETDAQRLVDLQQQVGKYELERDNACRQVEHLQYALTEAEQRWKSMEGDVGSLGAKLEAERTNAQMEAEHLKRALTDAEQRQKSTEAAVGSLGSELEEERSKARTQVEQLERALTEAEQRQESMEAQVGLLESRIEEQRGNTRNQVEQLQRTLADAEQRQKSTQAHMGSLEAMIEEERNAHKSGIVATENFLVRMQSELETRLKLQTELTDTLQDVALRLQGAIQFQHERLNSSVPKLMLMAVVLFITGTLAGVFILQGWQDGGRELAVVERDLDDLRVFVKQHLDKPDALLNERSPAHDGQAAKQALVEEKPPVPASESPGVEKPPLNPVAFEPDYRALQAGLITLGFDLGIARPDGEPGIKTRQALQEFGQFYLPDGAVQDDIVSEPLAAQILKSADRVRADTSYFNVGNDVLAAIRLGSIRTGVDFSFLMELARVESNFNPVARAPRSSATGLFQFKDHAWLEAIQRFGADYGLEDYAKRVKPIDNENHESTPIVRDPLQLEVLGLRLNPRLSTLMAAENIRRNLQILSDKTGHEPGRTELYLAHYLGPDGAVMFLKTLDEAPATSAGEVFPEEAASNPVVFEGRNHQPRTVAEVYRYLDSKFNTARYDIRNPG